MSLTPLHYRKKQVYPPGYWHQMVAAAHSGTTVAVAPVVIAPHYGASSYETDCGRFVISKITAGSERWVINSNRGKRWRIWLGSVGLDIAEFTIRREALNALEHALVADDLMEADTPS